MSSLLLRILIRRLVRALVSASSTSMDRVSVLITHWPSLAAKLVARQVRPSTSAPAK